VLEFDKDDIRQVLAVLKARTGKPIIYQDEEAQKQMGGGSQKKQGDVPSGRASGGEWISS
jgi:hypothetical protein